MDKQNPEYLAYLIDGLLRYDQAEEAGAVDDAAGVAGAGVGADEDVSGANGGGAHGEDGGSLTRPMTQQESCFVMPMCG